MKGKNDIEPFDKLRANGRNVYFQSNDIGPNPSVNSAPSEANDFSREGGTFWLRGSSILFMGDI